MKRALMLALMVALAGVASAADYVVIVNAANPLNSVAKTTIRSYFLGTATRWPDGTPVKPIDLPDASPVRAQFSKEVLGKEPGAVKSYWLTMVFAGRGTPPLQLDSDEKVVAAVAASPGAVAYVSKGVALGGGVKVVRIAD